MRIIKKICKHCETEFLASCGKEEFCTDQCKIKSNVTISDNGCWVWNRAKDKDGYGYVKAKGHKTVKVHRAAYALFNGEIDAGKMVCHKCDNPSCCNPEHLFLGTAAENKTDSVIKDRHVTGDRCHKAKLTKEQASYVLSSSLSAPEIAKELGIHRNSIYCIRKGMTWKSLQNYPAS